MIVSFKTARLRKQCNSQRHMVKAFGDRRAKVLRGRLDDLRAAGTLQDMRHLGGDCHEYRHQKGYMLTLDLDGGWRLFFRPDHDPVPLLKDGVSLDWTQVTAIEITDVRDPHG